MLRCCFLLHYLGLDTIPVPSFVLLADEAFSFLSRLPPALTVLTHSRGGWLIRRNSVRDLSTNDVWASGNMVGYVE